MIVSSDGSIYLGLVGNADVTGAFEIICRPTLPAPVERETKGETMADWKFGMERAIAQKYPGTMVRWDGDNPTLVVPDELENQAREIALFFTALWKYQGGEVNIHLDRAVRR